jgi:hypothetical protein
MFRKDELKYMISSPAAVLTAPAYTSTPWSFHPAPLHRRRRRLRTRTLRRRTLSLRTSVASGFASHCAPAPVPPSSPPPSVAPPLRTLTSDCAPAPAPPSPPSAPRTRKDVEARCHTAVDFSNLTSSHSRKGFYVIWVQAAAFANYNVYFLSTNYGEG